MLESDCQTLSELLQRNALPQVVLFYSREGMDTASLLTWLLQKLFCQHDNACGRCNDCRDIISGKHHEILTFDAEKRKFGVESVDTMQEFLQIRSAGERGVRVVTIVAAHLVTVQAANKLLKTLEEPGGGSYIFLVSDSYLQVLPTVASRCFHFMLRKTSSLSATTDPYYEEVEKLVAASNCSGRLGWIKKLKEKELDLRQFLPLYEKHLNATYRKQLRAEPQKRNALPRLRRMRLHEAKIALLEHHSYLNMQLGIEVALMKGDSYDLQ